MNFKYFQIQKWMLQRGRAEKVDEKNWVACVVFMFPSWVMILKLSEKVFFFQFCANLSKNVLRDDTHLTSMKIVQFSRHPTPLSIYVQNSSTPWNFDVQFQTTPPLSKWYRACERTKSKQKQNQVKSHSNWPRVLSFGLAPQTVSLKDDFTVWRQREDSCQ